TSWQSTSRHSKPRLRRASSDAKVEFVPIMNLPFRKLRWLLLLTASFLLLWGHPLAEGRSPRPTPTPEKTTFLPQEKHRPPVWSSTRSLTAHENAFAHWRKHQDEFPE